jgi:hypothetical protein
MKNIINFENYSTVLQEQKGNQFTHDNDKKYKSLSPAKTLMGLKEGHGETENYMFFGNLETMKSMIDDLLKMDMSKIDTILSKHDWASDHISVAGENLEHVYNFIQNEHIKGGNDHEEVEITPELVISDSKEGC